MSEISPVSFHNHSYQRDKTIWYGIGFLHELILLTNNKNVTPFSLFGLTKKTIIGTYNGRKQYSQIKKDK